ncbi:hypothetical protein CP532_5179 [Ophiocordyceps camponoti-leonardi (nom. inval.)]|nr:hypothetical protein CP532_5179 [Ophiocordyceps camponoti-leonardi (nom. inval.)]
MGILAQRKTRKSRRTRSQDPNNSKWMRDTSTYGQKIMRAQGWESGQLLGAQNTATSKLHSQASAACIRVTLKDDVRGLGYSQAAEDRVTGLDVFSDVLSRLNGKSEEEVTMKKQERLVLQSNMYLQQKWGIVNFVRGGFLVGDVPEEKKDEEEGEDIMRKKGTEKSDATEKVKKSKKRKLGDDGENSMEEEKKKKKKKRRKEEKRRARMVAQDGQEGSEDKEMMAPGGERCDQSADVEVTVEEEEKPRKKTKTKDKARRSDDDGELKKESKKEKKKKKREMKGEEEGEEEEQKEKKTKKSRRKDEAAAEAEAEVEVGAETEGATGTESEAAKTAAAEGARSAPTMKGHRNFVRSRFIAAKRQAMMDTQALNQIFMIKT